MDPPPIPGGQRHDRGRAGRGADLADALKADPYKISPLAGSRSAPALRQADPADQTSSAPGAPSSAASDDRRRTAGSIGEREAVAESARVLAGVCRESSGAPSARTRIEEMPRTPGPVVNASPTLPPVPGAGRPDDRPREPRPVGRAEPRVVGDGANKWPTHTPARRVAGCTYGSGRPKEFSRTEVVHARRDAGGRIRRTACRSRVGHRGGGRRRRRATTPGSRWATRPTVATGQAPSPRTR